MDYQDVMDTIYALESSVNSYIQHKKNLKFAVGRPMRGEPKLIILKLNKIIKQCRTQINELKRNLPINEVNEQEPTDTNI